MLWKCSIVGNVAERKILGFSRPGFKSWSYFIFKLIDYFLEQIQVHNKNGQRLSMYSLHTPVQLPL